MIPQKKFWAAMSKFIADKYGVATIEEEQKVSEILKDCFGYLVSEFRNITISQKNAGFYLYIFWLHEESIKLMVKFREVGTYDPITENEFAFYRRVLKLILEQGCEIDFPTGKYPDAVELLKMDKVIEELIYLGTWIYHIADDLAYHEMAESGHKIVFETDGTLTYPWQFHYGTAYDTLMPAHKEDYKHGVYDKTATEDLKNAIETSFNISYDLAIGIIFHIKDHFGKGDPCQTISPEVLPVNLSNQSGINIELSKTFYYGLTISKHNKLTIEEAVYKPHHMQRYLFRPILIYNIAGQNRALIGDEKLRETIYVLGTNAVQWSKISDEWITVPVMKSFIDKKNDDHDKILEDEIENRCDKNGILFLRTVESLKQQGDNNINIIEKCGEIDFIIANLERKMLFVADCKYHRARYDGVGHKTDNTNFIQNYETKLEKKFKWISTNIPIVEYNLKTKYPNVNFNLREFKIEAIFLINTPTFYMFNGKFKAITLHRSEEYILGKFDYPTLYIDTPDLQGVFRHPYFRKPIIFDF